MKILKSLGMLIGRVCISVIFILAGINKLTHWDMTAGYMAAKGMTMVPFFLVITIILEFFGGLALALGLRTRLAATLLLLYLIPVTGIFHNFWTAEAAEQQVQMINFMKNLAIFGGLMVVASTGAGPLSIDRFFFHKEHEEHNN